MEGFFISASGDVVKMDGLPCDTFRREVRDGTQMRRPVTWRPRKKAVFRERQSVVAAEALQKSMIINGSTYCGVAGGWHRQKGLGPREAIDAVHLFERLGLEQSTSESNMLAKSHSALEYCKGYT